MLRQVADIVNLLLALLSDHPHSRQSSALCAVSISRFRLAGQLHLAARYRSVPAQ